MKCEHCDIIERKNASEIIYEDNEVIVAIKDLVLTPGQITIFPKEHFTILELVPDHILEKCVSIANKVSIAIFDSLGCQGTNFLVQNGLGAGQIVPHFSIEIIPRIENDNLDLRWDTKPLPEDEMEDEETRRITTGGKRGYELLNRFLVDAKRFLNKNGQILIVFSSLTHKDKIDETLKKNKYKFECLEKKKLFFEELYVYLIS